MASPPAPQVSLWLAAEAYVSALELRLAGRRPHHASG
jgi:hypothetical protein